MSKPNVFPTGEEFKGLHHSDIEDEDAQKNRNLPRVCPKCKVTAHYRIRGGRKTPIEKLKKKVECPCCGWEFTIIKFKRATMLVNPAVKKPEVRPLYGYRKKPEPIIPGTCPETGMTFSCKNKVRWRYFLDTNGLFKRKYADTRSAARKYTGV